MVRKVSPDHEHAKMFAPILIGIAASLAILGSFPVFFPKTLPISNAMVKTMTYEDCLRLTDSLEVADYPPACVSASGRWYYKKLPKVWYPPTPTN